LSAHDINNVFTNRNYSSNGLVHYLFDTRAGFTNRLCRLKSRASRSKGTSSELWYA